MRSGSTNGVGSGDRERSLIVAAIEPHDERAAEAWRAWRRECPDLEGLSRTERRLLPFVWTRLERSEVADTDDPHAGRLRGLARRAWFHNHALLGEAARAQSTLRSNGIDSVVGGHCGLFTMDPDRCATLASSSISLLVERRDLRSAARTLAPQRRNRHVRSGRAFLRGDGHDPIRLRSATSLAARRPWPVGTAATLQVADPATLLAHHLVDSFDLAPPGSSTGLWVVDLDVALKGLDEAEADQVLVDMTHVILAGRRLGDAADHASAARATLGDATPARVFRFLHLATSGGVAATR